MKTAPLLLIAAMLILPCSASADIVIMKDGSRMEGIVKEEGANIRIILDYGHVILPMSRISQVIKCNTPRQEYEKKLAAIPEGDNDKLEALLQWCREKKLENEAKKLVFKIAKLNLKKKVEDSQLNTSKALFEMALWSKQNGYDDSVVESFLWNVIEKEKDHEAAREMLGFRKFRGQWLKKKEIDYILETEYEKTMRLKGMLKYKGQWLTSDATSYMKKLEDLEREKDNLARDRLRVEDEFRAAAREREELSSFERQLAFEKSRIELQEDTLERTALHQAMAAQKIACNRRENERLERNLEYIKNNLEKEKEYLRKEREELEKDKRRIELLKHQLECELRKKHESKIDEKNCRPGMRRPINPKK